MASNPKLREAAISQKEREKSATFTQNSRTSGQKSRFPMPDAKHARLALQDLPKAKNMPPGMASKVKNRADRMLGK